jgi:uncharacterized membrane protein YbhN (UPF0104 family)
MSKGAPAGRTSMTDATGAVLADKGLDAVVMIAVAAFVSGGLFTYAAKGALVALLAALGAVAAAISGFFVLRKLRPELVARVRSAIWVMASNMRTLFTPARLSRGLALAVAVIGAEVVGLVVLCSGLGISLGIGGGLYVLTILCLGIVFPVSVASIGPYEAAIAFGLRRFGVPMAEAIAIGTMHHAIQLLTVGLFAFAVWACDRLAAFRRTAQRSAVALLETVPARLSRRPQTW